MIYLVEDDKSIRELVLYTLTNAGFEAQGFGRPGAFWEALRIRRPALVILDIMLPEEDGLSILRSLRAAPDTQQLPVMMLTAKSTEYDTVLALDAGADDYVPKPFRMLELLSRIRALLRRAESRQTPPPEEYREGPLYVSPSRYLVQVEGREVSLTRKEFALLCFLLRNRGMVLSRDAILNRVWQDSTGGESRTVDVHIRTLRQKLGKAGAGIETVRGVGYRFQALP